MDRRPRRCAVAGRPSPSVTWPVRSTSLRDRGIRVVFATNNSSPTTGQLDRPTDRGGDRGRARRSHHLGPGGRVAAGAGTAGALLAEAGMLEALVDRGVEVADPGRRDAAVVGWSRDFDFAALAAISAVARETGRLIATNGDPTHPTPEGLMPGSGALLAAVATASGVVPQVAGKPYPPDGRVHGGPRPRRTGPGHRGDGGGPAGHRRRPGRRASVSPSCWSTRG